MGKRWIRRITYKNFRKTLEKFKKISRFLKIVYICNNQNQGIAASLNEGVLKCSNEIIFRMDSDDIMLPQRMNIQLKFMTANPDVHICGTQMYNLKNNIVSKHPPKKTVTWNDFKETKPNCVVSHPTVCFRKTSVLSVGNYDKSLKNKPEDLDLWIKMLKKYGKIVLLEDYLVYYRIHDGQITKNKNFNHNFTENLKKKYIKH